MGSLDELPALSFLACRQHNTQSHSWRMGCGVSRGARYRRASRFGAGARRNPNLSCLRNRRELFAVTCSYFSKATQVIVNTHCPTPHLCLRWFGSCGGAVAGLRRGSAGGLGLGRCRQARELATPSRQSSHHPTTTSLLQSTPNAPPLFSTSPASGPPLIPSSDTSERDQIRHSRWATRGIRHLTG